MKDQLEELETLEQQGVQVAAESANPWQRMIVYTCQLVMLATGIHHGLTNIWIVLLLLPLCLVMDFLSGLLHWYFDTMVQPGPTRLGRIAVDFLDHHVRPTRTTQVEFIVSAYRPALFVALPLLVLSYAFVDITQALIFWIAAISLYIPQAHKFAHLHERPHVISLLQQRGILLSPKAHASHHKTHDCAYCVFTGWLNPLLDSSQFWRRVENLLGHQR